MGVYLQRKDTKVMAIFTLTCHNFETQDRKEIIYDSSVSTLKCMAESLTATPLEYVLLNIVSIKSSSLVNMYRANGLDCC